MFQAKQEHFSVSFDVTRDTTMRKKYGSFLEGFGKTIRVDSAAVYLFVLAFFRHLENIKRIGVPT